MKLNEITSISKIHLATRDRRIVSVSMKIFVSIASLFIYTKALSRYTSASLLEGQGSFSPMVLGGSSSPAHLVSLFIPLCDAFQFLPSFWLPSPFFTTLQPYPSYSPQFSLALLSKPFLLSAFPVVRPTSFFFRAFFSRVLPNL